MKILLAKRRALGDTVLLSSSVALLRKKFPRAEISVLVPGAFAPVLEGNPEIQNIFTFEMGWWQLQWRLRAERFDYFLQLHASPRSRWWSALAGAKHTHFHYQNKETEQAYGKHPHALEWDGFFFRTIFGPEIPLPAEPPKIFLNPEERALGEKFWWEKGVDPKRVIFLGLGASRQTKRWLPTHFAELADLLRGRNDLIPALVVGPGEAEAFFAGQVIDALRSRTLRPFQGGLQAKGDFLHLAGLSVRTLAQALSPLKAYVGNDSGPKHMAAALGVPTFTLFGPEDPVEWHPYERSQHPVFFLEGLPCRREDQGRWCGIAFCDQQSPEKHRCMADLEPLVVYETMKSTLCL